ncbi:Uncharacterised protein [Vibrio cholerae]|nr:Uncharacterised protein [Vibrio cholerae]CSI30827.1 Uncharacterised protein [Vibrio cholerae]CSI69922.1 Uncharacterised protein [Vibrio cholerae]
MCAFVFSNHATEFHKPLHIHFIEDGFAPPLEQYKHQQNEKQWSHVVVILLRGIDDPAPQLTRDIRF